MEIKDIHTAVATNYGDLAQKFAGLWADQVQKLRDHFGDAVEAVRMPAEFPVDVPVVFVKKDRIVEVLGWAKSTPGLMYDFLSDITATDEESDPRFEVVYQLYSMSTHARIRFKTKVREGEFVPSLISVWPAADWAEREVYDMFGIQFSGHPDLRRILMDERWEGHPLRKDYPLRGYQIFPSPQAIDPSRLE